MDAEKNGNATQSVALTIGSAILSKVNSEFSLSTQTLSLATITTVADVLKHIGLAEDTVLLIVLNDTMVPRTTIQTQQLTNGDKLSLMPPIHAG